VIQAAYELNVPLIAKQINGDGGEEPTAGLLEIDSDQVVIETVKKAQSGKGIIVRLYEAHGGSCSASLKANFNAQRAFLADGLENELEPLDIKENQTPLQFRPYEIKTIKILSSPV
jgi:alpha-mannosidase